jgi:hypothetical protein
MAKKVDIEDVRSALKNLNDITNVFMKQNKHIEIVLCDFSDNGMFEDPKKPHFNIGIQFVRRIKM